jgi:hypothetical protein
MAEALGRLADAWEGGGLRSAKERVLARVRADSARPPARATRILADPPAPLVALATAPSRRAVVALGRTIPTPTPRDRALARLSQRLLQEELDARLVVSGPLSLWIVLVPVSGDPVKGIDGALRRMDRFAATEHQVERLRHAAQLWLGARVVEASLQDEDWTALWSESLDLADDDAGLTRVLGRDAAFMLDADPASLRKWQERWVRPRGGEPGWTWVAAGLDAAARARLAEVVRIEPRD